MNGLTLEEQLAKNIKLARELRKLNLKTLAEGMNVSIALISKMENRKSGISIEFLEKISEFYNVPPTYFFDTEKVEENHQNEKWLAFNASMDKMGVSPEELEKYLQFGFAFFEENLKKIKYRS